MELYNFKTPDDLFRGTDFWMLNGELSEENIVEQLTQMKNKGVYSFIARTYLGLKSDYPGPDFKEKTRLIIETSKKLGLKVFLQAGYMPEAVLGLSKEHALRYIIPVKEGEENGRPIFCNYNGYSFVEHNSETFLDMFDPDSMEHYVKTSYENMWKEFSHEYGKTVISIWVDEPSYNSEYIPWTPKLEKLFLERWGYSIADKIWMLYFDSPDSNSLRYHYRVIMRDLLEENYFKKIEKWCRQNNLMFSGHLMMEETMRSQILRAQACMPYYKYFDIPGMDVLRGDMKWVDDPLVSSDLIPLTRVLYNTVTQCVSAAKQAGKKHILAEMYGVAGENFGFRNMTHMFDSYAASGINHRSVHGYFYTLHGRGKRAYPPHIGHYQPFWKKYKNITDYCARVSAFISDGESACDIAVIHPLETGYMLFKGAIGSSGAGGNELRYLDDLTYDLLVTMRSNQFEVDFADLASIRDLGYVENGLFCVGKMKYKTVILPELQVITDKLLELLTEFARQGGKIIVLNKAPFMLDGNFDSTLPCKIERISQKAESISSVLEFLEPNTFKISGIGVESLLINHRFCNDGEKFFICNKDCTHDAQISFFSEAKGEIYVYNAYTGEISEYPYSKIDGVIRADFTIRAGASLLLSIENKRDNVDAPITIPCSETAIKIGGEWSVKCHNENAFFLEYCRVKKQNGEFSEKLPILAIQRLLSQEEYRGNIILEYTFDTITPLENISLSIEDPRIQKITVDGNAIDTTPNGYFFEKTFEKVSIGNISAGKHTIEIEREFYPLSKVTNALTQLFETRHGIELEPMYLIGDFLVKGHRYRSDNGSAVFTPDFTLSALPKETNTFGELTDNGFPFFVGEISLFKNFEINENRDLSKAKLRIETMNAGCGELFVNGKYAGDINRAPCDIAIGDFLKNGINAVEIKLYTTLFNIVGPFHRPLGNLGNTFGGGYANPDAAWLSVDTSVPGWEKKLSKPNDTWTNRYNVAPLGIKNISIIF